MRIVFSISFFFLICFQAFHLPMLSLWLHYQQDYIAQYLCENRMEPELMCSGRCYINEQTAEAIGQQDQQSTDTPLSIADWSRMLSPFILSKVTPTATHTFAFNQLVFPSENFYQFRYAASIFQPPRLV